MKWLWCFGVAWVCMLLVWIGLQWPSARLRVTFCDVGQGDAILIQHGFEQVLIDGGKDPELVLLCLEEQVPFWDRQLEIVVATHADADHIGGLSAVVERYRVGQIVIEPIGKTTAQFLELHAAIRDELMHTASYKAPFLGDTVTLPRGTSLRFLWPQRQMGDSRIFLQPQSTTSSTTETTLSDILEAQEQQIDNYNARSSVLFLHFGEVSMLLMGDLEAEGELALIEAGLIGKVDVVKAGHHGAKTSSTLQFIEKTRPEYAIFSAGRDNSYGHPDSSVVERFRAYSSHIFSTPECGSITLETDGEHIWPRVALEEGCKGWQQWLGS